MASPWGPAWDLEYRGHKLEVKARAARQAWTDRQQAPSIPDFEFKRRVADLYVFAWHSFYDPAICDQRNAGQWEFYVVPTGDLPAAPRAGLGLKALMGLTCSVPAQNLRVEVDRFLDAMSRQAVP